MVWERFSGLFLSSKYNETVGLLPAVEGGGGNLNMQHLRKKSDKNKTSFCRYSFSYKLKSSSKQRDVEEVNL